MARTWDNTTSNYITGGSAPVTAVPISMACWAKCTTSTDVNYLMAVDEATDDQFSLLVNATNNVQAATRVAGTESLASSSTTFTDATWFHAAAVFAAANDRRAFLNGGGKGTNASNRTPTGINGMHIGVRDMGSIAVPMNGQIAHCAIWASTLSDAQVAVLATGVHPMLVDPANLVFYAPLWGNSSPELDIIGGVTLTITGTLAKADGPRLRGWGRSPWQIQTPVSAGFPVVVSNYNQRLPLLGVA